MSRVIMLFMVVLFTANAYAFGTKLGNAIENNDIAYVEKAINNGLDLNKIDKVGFTPLMYAASYGSDDILKLLLRNGADSEVSTKDGAFALIYAVTNQRLNAVRILLETGANPNRVYLETTPLKFSMKNTYGDYPKITELLKKHGAKQ